MSVTLRPETERLIAEKIASGAYTSPDEVVEDALRALDERNRLAELRAKLQRGVDQLDRGESVLFTPEGSASRIARAKQRAANGEQPNPDVRA